jgi:hypothetical protein
MNTTTIKSALRQFFTLRPARDYTIRTSHAIMAAVLIVITQLTDYMSTLLGLKLGRSEANGGMAKIINDHGNLAFLGIKGLGAAVLIYLTFRRRFAPWIVGILYALVTLWNLVVTYIGIL